MKNGLYEVPFLDVKGTDSIQLECVAMENILHNIHYVIHH